jgi:hypothetical protein
MNELSSDDALWRRFCGTDKQPTDKGVDVGVEEEEETTTRSRHVWKTTYMAWLRPNLRQLGQSQGTTCAHVHRMKPGQEVPFLLARSDCCVNQLWWTRMYGYCSSRSTNSGPLA